MAEPSKEELASFKTLVDVITWAELDGDCSDPKSIAGSFLKVLGATANTRVTTAGSISASDFDKAVQSWKINDEGSEPTPIQKAQVGMIGRACRLAAGMEKPAAVIQAENEAAAHAASLHAAVAHKAAMSSSDVRKIKLSQVISQTDESETTSLSESELKVAYGRYELLFGSGVTPPPQKECSGDQLAALKHQLQNQQSLAFSDYHLHICLVLFFITQRHVDVHYGIYATADH